MVLLLRLGWCTGFGRLQEWCSWSLGSNLGFQTQCLALAMGGAHVKLGFPLR